MSKNNSEASEVKTMKRSLTNTHIQLIALGGTIGTGLFLGVGNSIELAGPAVIFIYCLVGFFLFLFCQCFGFLLCFGNLLGRHRKLTTDSRLFFSGDLQNDRKTQIFFIDFISLVSSYLCKKVSVF